MAQLSDDCFAFGGQLMSAGEAMAILKSKVHAVAEVETVALSEARGRILAAPVVATRDVPPHDNAAVDGYAVNFADLKPGEPTILPIGGRAAAGHPLGRPLQRGECIRIFTGAPMPDGADTVLMQEDCRVTDGKATLPPGIKPGANRRFAGEDVKRGATVLGTGRRLRPQEIGLAASLGLTTLTVRRKLRVAIFSTGDEVREPGGELPPGAIFDSNRYTLRALLEGLSGAVTDLGILPDSLDAVRGALARAAEAHDLVLTSGGMSTGEEDHVKAVVETLGSLHFWRLAIKPGRPLALGQIHGKAFIGLPGNPVAMMVTFLRFARPVLLRLVGAKETGPVLYRVRADFEHKKKADRREWVRARLVVDSAGGLVAKKFPREGAGILSSMVESDGLVELPESLTHLAAGSMVDFLPFSEVS